MLYACFVIRGVHQWSHLWIFSRREGLQRKKQQCRTFVQEYPVRCQTFFLMAISRILYLSNYPLVLCCRLNIFSKARFLLKCWRYGMIIAVSSHYMDYCHGWFGFTVWFLCHCSSTEVHNRILVVSSMKQTGPAVTWSANVVYFTPQHPLVALSTIFSTYGWICSKELREKSLRRCIETVTEKIEFWFHACYVGIAASTIQAMVVSMNEVWSKKAAVKEHMEVSWIFPTKRETEKHLNWTLSVLSGSCTTNYSLLPGKVQFDKC